MAFGGWWAPSTSKPSQPQPEADSQPQPDHLSSQSSPIVEQLPDSLPTTDAIPPSNPTPAPAASKSQKASADALDRDEAAYEELRDLFRAASSSADDPRANPTDAATAAAAEEDDSLYASTLSCSQCFDAAYYCSSIGGQLSNVYRYGGLRSCSDLWAQWRFCMRTKTMSEAERRRRIREWNREKEGRRRVGRNSEEIWKLRRLGEGQEEAVPALFAAAASASEREHGAGEALNDGDTGEKGVVDGAVGKKVGWGWR